MDLFDVVRACIRRWYLFLPMLAVAVWSAHHMYASVKPVYYSSAIVTVAPPSQRVGYAAAGAEIPRNGLLDVGGAPFITNLATFGLHSAEVLAEVVKAGGKGGYEAKPFPTPPGQAPLPLIMIESTDASPGIALATVTAVVQQADPVVRRVQQQAGVPDGEMVRMFVVSPPGQPIPGTPTRTRTAVSVLLTGIALSILLAVVADAVISRWSARRRRVAQQHDHAATDGGHEPRARVEAERREEHLALDRN